MRMERFFESDDGAVTVDWVVLTAGLAALGLATMAVVSGGVGDLSDETSAELASVEPSSMYDWVSDTALVNSGWGDLGIFSSIQSAAGAESYAASVLAANGGDYQAAYDQLYQQALDMTYANGESVDDFGAFEAMAAAAGVSLDTAGDMTYAEMHAAYTANGSL